MTFVHLQYCIKFGLSTYFASNMFLESTICFEFEGLIFGGAYIRRGLYTEFYGITLKLINLVWNCLTLKDKITFHWHLLKMEVNVNAIFPPLNMG